MEQNIDIRLAQKLKTLRSENEFSLNQLAELTGISRATLSRIENAEVSPTAAILGKLCATFNITMSHLLALVEAEFAPLVTSAAQEVWTDPETGYSRKLISPPSVGLSAEMLECHMPKGQKISYEAPPRQALEHHIYMLKGCLQLDVDGQEYELKAGDCLRYKLYGASQFKTTKTQPATYILTLV